MNDTSPKDQKKPVSTIVVSRPGIMQQLLRTILVNLQEIVVICYAGDGLTALSQVRRNRPGLLVLDHNLLEEEVQALLLAVKGEYPATRCLVITPSRMREESLTAWGADAVVFRNAPRQELRAALLQLAQEARVQSK